MADWSRSFSNGSNFTHWFTRLNYIVTSQDVANNRTYIELRNYVHSESGAYSQNGPWDGRLYINGGQVSRNTPTANISSSDYLMNAYGQWVGHDGNGYCTVNIGNYVNAPVNEMTYATTGWTLPRLPLAPSIAGISADTIKPTTARLGTELNNYGHGTSTACRFYYRKAGDVSYLNTSDQSDVGGWNYFDITGLKPNTTYEYFARWWNNNGDTSDSSVATFKTQSVAGMVPVLMGLVG